VYLSLGGGVKVKLKQILKYKILSTRANTIALTAYMEITCIITRFCGERTKDESLSRNGNNHS